MSSQGELSPGNSSAVCQRPCSRQTTSKPDAGEMGGDDGPRGSGSDDEHVGRAPVSALVAAAHQLQASALAARGRT